MTRNKRSELGREENHLVKATVIVDDFQLTDVPCKIFLPERIEEKPCIVLKPSEQVANKIMAFHKGALRARVYGFNKEIELTIESPEVFFSRSSTKYWGDGISDSTIPGEPQDLHIVHHHRTDANVQRTKIAFWISPNQFLNPLILSTSSYTGDLTYKRVRNFEFLIKNQVRLVFDKNFRSKSAENGDFIQWSFLVACAELDVPADNAATLSEIILPDVDDFLLIASFAARQRTACLGWAASDKSSYTTFYRGNYVFPDTVVDNTFDNRLINTEDFERFVHTCYPVFLEFENKLAIRNALYSILPSQSGALETTFLKVFAGLETIILDFRRREELEFIVPEVNWGVLKKYLQKCLKSSTEPKLEATQRASMYCKLDELNRVSLREAFDLFCKKYSVDLADLWPVFGKKDLVGLVDIRNKLIHGDPFPDDMADSLIVANEHLIYVVERVLIRIFKWNLQETKISPAYLQAHMLAIKDMAAAQTKLSEYIKIA